MDASPGVTRLGLTNFVCMLSFSMNLKKPTNRRRHHPPGTPWRILWEVWMIRLQLRETQTLTFSITDVQIDD